MNAEPGNNSDSDDTLTSSDLSDLSDYEAEGDDDDFCETESCRSLVFSVASNKSTATVKSSKSKKKVRFKPGDSLVLVYVIPNREMLGLHSASESSDSEYSASDSDDEDDVKSDSGDETKDNDSDENDNDGDDDENDYSTEDEESEEESDDGDVKDKNNNVERRIKAKPVPIGKLVSVRKLNTRKSVEFPKPIKKQQPENVQKLISLDVPPAKFKQKTRKSTKQKEKKEKGRTKREVPKPVDKAKKEKGKKTKKGAIKADVDKTKGAKKSKSRLLEIKATVDTNHKTNVSVPKLVYKSDFKPSVVDVNGSNLSGSNTKPLIARSKLQPTSIRLSKRTENTNVVQNKVVTTPPPVEKPRALSRVVAANYDSLSSVMPSSYVSFHQAFNNLQTVDESVQRLDPNDMNASNKRLYAWQIANGNITSQTLRTPSILPFLDSLKTSIVEKGAVDVPS